MYLVHLQHWRLLIYFHPKLHKHPLFALRLLAKATQQNLTFQLQTADLNDRLSWKSEFHISQEHSGQSTRVLTNTAYWFQWQKINLEIPNHINTAGDEWFRMIQVDESQKFMELNWRSPTVNSINVQLTIVLHENLAWSMFGFGGWEFSD